jgi:hypothetical protein
VEGLILPFAGSAFGHAQEAHSLDREFAADERIEIHAPGNDIAPKGRGRFVHHAEARAEFIVDFARKESDLALVVGFVVEKAVAFQAASGQAADLRHLEHGVLPRWFAIVAEEIMTG